MPNDHNKDLATIKEWIVMQPHLSHVKINDLLLRKFLHSCYYSLEQTKQCIDTFCTRRTLMSEQLYSRRDPLLPKIKYASSVTQISAFQIHDNHELLIHKINGINSDKFAFYDLLKAFTLVGEAWLMHHDFLAEGHYIVMDMKEYILSFIPKINIMFLREFLLFLLEAMPVRIKQIHLLNCPVFVDKMYMLVKPVLPNHICELIHFHTTVESFHKFVDKKYLPEEYGGDIGSLSKQTEMWLDQVYKDRDFFLKDEHWKADLKKKPKSSEVDIMNGSFKTLQID